MFLASVKCSLVGSWLYTRGREGVFPASIYPHVTLTGVVVCVGQGEVQALMYTAISGLTSGSVDHPEYLQFSC